MAAMLSARWSPSRVPRAAASSTLASGRSSAGRTCPRVSGTSVSGTSIFESRIAPGAVMITAVRMWRGSTP